jgi:metallo-beta-lactamase class B
LSDDVTVRKLAKGVWLHTTYFDIGDFRNVPANGLIVIDEKCAMMIDLPWTDKQAGVLFDWVSREHKAVIQKVVPTHFHIDCAGGLAEAHRRGAESFALRKTVELLKKENKTVPQNWFTGQISLSYGESRIVLAFLGGGHTVDNIVVWIPSKQILFAGCLIKSLNAKNIGNIEDADLAAYPTTLRKVKETFPDAKIVVPGHGRPGGLELINHTITLCKDRR